MASSVASYLRKCILLEKKVTMKWVLRMKRKVKMLVEISKCSIK